MQAAQAGAAGDSRICAQFLELEQGTPLVDLPRDGVLVQLTTDEPPPSLHYAVTLSGGGTLAPHRCGRGCGADA